MKNHILHYFALKFALNRELDELYLSIMLRFFALSMVGIFVPLFMINELGLALNTVLFFYIMLAIFFAIFGFIGAKISCRIGFKHSILLSVPFSILFLILLRLYSQYSIPLWTIALVEGIALGIYWVAHHVDFAKFSVEKARGKEVGITHSIIGLASVIGPITGGFIISYFNFVSLFSVVIVLLFLSTLPLFYSSDLYEKCNFSLKYIFRKEHIRDALTYTAFGIEAIASSVLWPIFIFSILLSYSTLGAVVTGAGLFIASLSIFVGKISDRIGKRKVIRTGTILDSALWLIKGFATKVFHVYGLTALAGIFSLSLLPIDALGYDKANQGRRVEYIVFRELFINVGRIILLLFMIIISKFLVSRSSFIASFIFTGIAELAYLLF